MAENYEVLGWDMESPLVNAAGSINGTNSETILRQVEELAGTGIGAITVGSFTIPRQEGNAAKYGEPVYYHDAKEGKTYNSMGLPNIGLAAAVELAPQIIERAKGKPVIFSGSPTIDPEGKYGSSVEQAKQLANTLLDAGVNLVEINVSCPNVVTVGGGRKPIMGYDLETMEELIDAFDYGVGREQRLGLKLPPYLSSEEHKTAKELSRRLLIRSVVQFIVTSNTIPNQVPLNDRGEPILSVPNGMGGMSGPATKAVGHGQLKLWKGLMKGDADIISTEGLSGGDDLKVRHAKLGADAAGGVTFLWESANWKDAVTRMLLDFAA